MREFHKQVRADLVAHARYRIVKAAQRDEDDLAALSRRLFAYGLAFATASKLETLIRAAAVSMSDSARKQVADAIGKDVPASLQGWVDDLVSTVLGNVQRRMVESVERAKDVFREWRALEPDDEDAGDPEALDGMLASGLLGVIGGAIASATLAYVATWGAMQEDAQTSAGVTSYIWVAQSDSVVRPAHLALDDHIAEWSDPPLKAEDSSIGEDCHPTEDYNCRCMAAPIPN